MPSTRFYPVPLAAPAHEGGALAETGETRITKEIAAQYFSGVYSMKRMAWHRLRRVIEMLRLAVIAFGLAICAAAFYVTWRETGTTDLNAFYAALSQRAFVLFTGALVAVIGAVPMLWRYHWQLPLGVFALGMAIEIFLLDLGYKLHASVMVVAALGVIVYSYLRPRTAKPLEDKELEEKLDLWIEQTVPEVVRKANLPVGGNLAGSKAFVLKSFPKRDRSGNFEVLCRIGQNRRPRITPLGVAVFDLRPDSMVAFEGAVDLRSEAVVYARVHEFRYDDIVALLWTHDAVPSAKPPTPGAAMAGNAARVVRHRDVLEIRLVSGRSVSLVFNDSELLPLEKGKPANNVGLIEEVDKIRALWDQILERQARARAGRAGV